MDFYFLLTAATCNNLSPEYFFGPASVCRKILPFLFSSTFLKAHFALTREFHFVRLVSMLIHIMSERNCYSSL